MARKLRVIVAGGWYHVVNRGNRREAIFRTDSDRRRFLGRVAEFPDLFGDKIQGVAGEPDCDGNPAAHRALEALFVYYQSWPNVVRNARIRWAQQCMRYVGTASGISHSLSDSLFEQSDLGLNASVPATSSVVMNNVQRTGVTTAVSGNYVTGSMADTFRNTSRMLRNQGEPAVAVRRHPTNPNETEVVIVAMHSGQHDGDTSGLILMISNDSGRTWNANVFADGAPGIPQAYEDSDPSLTFDDPDGYGNLYLPYRTKSPLHFVFCVSADAGAPWTEITSFPHITPIGGAHPRL